MASTSNIKKSPIQSRISPSVNYNSEYQQPRQILPMSRSASTQHLSHSQNRSYQQQQLVASPQIIVPTQFGQSDFSMTHTPTPPKDMYVMQAPMQNISMDYYHSQQNYFHPIQAYPSY